MSSNYVFKKKCNVSQPAITQFGNYMFKVNNRRHSGVFVVNYEHISHLVLVFLLLTLNM